MKKEEFEFILEKGEGYFIEFKESLDKSLSRELVAFANSSGGQIFLGVNDNNKAKGIEITNKLRSRIQDFAANIQPTLDISLSEHDNVLIINVPEGIDKPYQCSDGFFLRMGANSQKMSRSQIIDFLQHEGKIRFEEQVHRYFDFEKHFNSSKLNGYLILSGITKNMDDISILENLGVLRKTGTTKRMLNAGVLFFSNNIDILLEQSIITCAVFEGKERIKVLNRKDFAEDIITNIENALLFIKQSLKVEYIMTGEARRQEIYEIPLQAIREAVVNAVAHRDYFADGSHITIDVFDDRLEIGNPGGLPKGLTLELFGKKAVRRNPIITNLLQRCNFVENMGTGINKIKELCVENNVKEPDFVFNEFFTVIFKRRLSVGETVGETVGEILKLIEINPQITRNELAKKTRLSVRGIEWNLKKMKEKKLIRRIGPDKGGYWQIIEKE